MALPKKSITTSTQQLYISIASLCFAFTMQGCYVEVIKVVKMSGLLYHTPGWQLNYYSGDVLINEFQGTAYVSNCMHAVA